MTHPENENEIYDLLIRFFENDVNDEQREKLLAWSQGDANAPKVYWDFAKDMAFIHSQMAGQIQFEYDLFDDTTFDEAFWNAMAEYEKTVPAVEDLREKPSREMVPKVVYPPSSKRKVTKLQILTLVTSAAAVLFIVLFAKLTPKPLPSVEVATLVDQMNVQRADPKADYENGSRLWSNAYPIDIKKGYLSILYDQGVRLVVEGPALFEIERAGIRLEYGRLFAEVSESGLGFTVNTPTSQFIDMGTEFGVKANIDGSSQLYVTRGAVQLFAGSIGESKNARMVTENRAVEYTEGQVREIQFTQNAFVREFNSVQKRTWRGSSAYEQAVRTTRPLYYWRFDGDRDGLLRNEMDSGFKDDYKLFGSLGYGEGPDMGNGTNVSLRLTGRAEDYAILRDCTDEADNNADGFTIALWIRPEKTDWTSASSIIMSFRYSKQEFRGGGRSLDFDNKNRFWFYFIPVDEQPDSPVPRAIHSNPVSFDTWHHVVVTYGKSDQMNMYINGRLEARERIAGSISRPTEDMQWCVGSGKSPARTSFKGSIDEICHCNRELSAEEVRMLYEASRRSD
jgi:hypothetical protein